MVCLGNICRSPIAEGVLKKYLPKDIFFIDSAGTSSYHVGCKPDHRSIEVAKRYGIFIENQKCRQFNVNDFKNFDHIFVMDKKNLHEVLSLLDNSKYSKKVQLLSKEEVPDPFYGGINEFADCFKLIDKACKKLAEKLLNND